MKRHVLALGALANFVCACSKQTAPQPVAPQPPAPLPIVADAHPVAEATPTPKPPDRTPSPTPQLIAQQAVATATVSQPRLAPKGIYFLLQHTSVVTDDGVVGLNPGAVLKLLSDNGASFHVTDGKQELDVPRNFLTNDLDVASAAFENDQAAQAKVNQQRGAARMEEASENEAEQAVQVRRNTMMDSANQQPAAWDNPLDHRPHDRNYNLSDNPLDRGAYNKIRVRDTNPSWLKSRLSQLDSPSPLSSQNPDAPTPIPQPTSEENKPYVGSHTAFSIGDGQTEAQAYAAAVKNGPPGDGWAPKLISYRNIAAGNSDGGMDTEECSISWWR